MNKKELFPNIEDRLETERPVLQSILFEHAERGAAFIDSDLERDCALLRYADLLTTLLHPTPGETQVTVAYQAIHFMSLIASLEGCNEGISMKLLVALPDSHEEAVGYIVQTAEMYFEARPQVEGVVDAYMPEIDPSGNDEFFAKTITGLVGSQLEDGIHEAAARSVEETIAAWDGALPADFQ